MTTTPKNKSATTQILYGNRWWIVLVALIYLVYLLTPILSPFLAAAVLAYICDPLVDKLSEVGIGKIKCGRTPATLLVMFGIVLGLVGLVLILIPLLQKQSVLIAEHLPLLLEHLRTQVEPWLQARFGISLNIDSANLQALIGKYWNTSYWSTTGNLLGAVVVAIGTQGLAMIGVLANVLLLPVVLFYFLRDWDVLVAKVGELIPREHVAQVSNIALDIDQVVAEFLRGQLMVMVSLCVFYSVGLWLVGLHMALAIGLIAGLLSFVPYLGFALAFILSLILAILQFTEITQVIPVLLVFGLGQVVESFILTPYLVGDRIGLHPVVVILALMAAGQLFGFVGVLFALPMSAAIAVGVKHTKASYLNSNAYLN